MNKENEDFSCARLFIKIMAYNIVFMTISCLPIIFQFEPDCFCLQIFFFLPLLWTFFVSPFVFLLVFLAVPYLFFVLCLCRSEDRVTGCSLLFLALVVAAINELISVGWLALLVGMTAVFG